jgi:hypothetical protein
MRFFFLLLWAFILVFLQTYIAWATSNSSISKEDACSLSDGLFEQSLSINNYKGYTVTVWSYFKDKKTLYYVVDATAIKGGDREAFLWSWNCTTKKPRQLSKYNFALPGKDENASQMIVSAASFNPIKIVFYDKEHIFIRQNRITKVLDQDKFLVFYRSNNQVSENFSLKKLRGFSDFKKSVLWKTVKIACNFNMEDGCDANGYIETYIEKYDSYDFFLQNIKISSDGRTYLDVIYKSKEVAICLPSVGPSTKEGCFTYYFRLLVDLRTGALTYDTTFKP